MDEYDDLFAATNITRPGAMAGALRDQPPRKRSSSVTNNIGAMTPAQQRDDWRARNRARQEEIDKQLEALNVEPDMSGLQAEAGRRREGATSQLLLALAAQQAGKDFEPAQAHFLKQSAAMREPMKFSGGMISETGEVVRDPMYQQEQRRKALESSRNALMQQELTGMNVDQTNAMREAMTQQQIASREQIAANALANRPEPLVQVYDAASKTTRWVPRSQAAGLQAPPKKGEAGAGRGLTPHATNEITALESRVAQFDDLIRTYKPSYSGLGTTIGNVSGKMNPWASDEQRAQSLWWSGYQEFLNDVRHGKFGASLTPGEKAEFEKSVVTADTDSRVVQQFLATQRRIAEKARIRHIQNLGKVGFDVSAFDTTETQPELPPGVTPQPIGVQGGAGAAPGAPAAPAVKKYNPATGRLE